MRYAVLFLALSWPDPVTSIGAARNPDGTITVTWTLPADPTVIGVRLERERLDRYDYDVYHLGTVSSFDDLSASSTRSYRYWVYTRDHHGYLSVASFVEIWSPDDDDHRHTRWHCHASASGAPPGILIAALLLLAGTACLRARRAP